MMSRNQRGINSPLAKYEAEALIAKHFNVGLGYIKDRMPWWEVIIRQAIALDLKEREDYHSYLLAGGKPKKFPWRSPDHAGIITPREGGLIQKVLREFKGKVMQGDIRHYAEPRGMRKIHRKTYRHPKSGEVVAVEYVDAETGEKVEVEEGKAFMRAGGGE